MGTHLDRRPERSEGRRRACPLFRFLDAIALIDRGIAIVLKSTKGYKGKPEFDIPRHQAYVGFKHDWPRMNTMPEWFTVDPDRSCRVKNMAIAKIGKYTGQQLHEGIPIELVLNQELRLTLSMIGK